MLLLAGALLFTDILEVGDGEELVELSTAPPEGRPAAAKEVGVAAYEFSEYKESSQAYQEARAQREEDWFPRKAVVEPKGPEGGEYPHAPLPVYASYPGKDFVTEDGETYKIDRTWSGDIAVGTEVTLENVGGQGEWCFVTAETIGGWTSSGRVWCYRLFIPGRDQIFVISHRQKGANLLPSLIIHFFYFAGSWYVLSIKNPTGSWQEMEVVCV